MKDTKRMLDEAIGVLTTLLEQVDEDCPRDCRTRHLEEAMQEADAMLKRYAVTQVNKNLN